MDKYTTLLFNPDGALRTGLFDTSSSGRLEVYFSGEWGTVCNDLFFQTEADVACRQLGYGSAITYGTVGSLGYVCHCGGRSSYGLL